MAQNQTFSVRYGDGKRKCGYKPCDQIIISNTIRIRKEVVRGGKPTNTYYHAECLFDSLIGAHKTTKVIESKGDLEGYINLTTKDKSVVDKLITDFTRKRTLKLKGALKPGVDAVPEIKGEKVGACSPAKETVKQGRGKETNNPQTKTTPKAPKLPETQNRYVTRSSRKGHMIIINNFDFKEARRHGESGLNDRTGSDKDEATLFNTFTRFGFVCETERNRKGQEIIKLLEEFTKKNSKYKEDDSVIVAVLSHGEEKNGKAVVLGTDGVKIEVDMIVNQVDGCSYLKGRPKFLIVQACRGTETNEEGHTADGPQRPIPSIRLPPVRSRKTEMTKDGESVAQFADMVIAQATWSGNAAFRHEIQGSPYIQTLCNVFKDNAATEHVTNMMIEVNKRMSRWSEGGKKQMPHTTNSLTKHWRLLDNES